MPTPGAIRHRRRASQLIDFSALNLNRGRTPTNVDMFLEFNGKIFIFGEYKFGNAPLPVGQRLALERTVDVLLKGGAAATCFVARHTHPAEEDIDGAAAIVTEAFLDGEWKPPKYTLNVRDFVLWYCRTHGVPGLPAQ